MSCKMPPSWTFLAGLSTAAAVSFSADLSGQTTVIRKPMLECFGSSHARSTLQADWRQALVQAKRDLGLKRVRFHGILNDDMSTYLDGHANMFDVFNTFDFLLASDIRPIVELSFTPDALASNSTTIMHYKANYNPPANPAAWQSFITEFVTLLLERYGAAEVHSWLFEMYNEPNCAFFNGNQTQYWDLYTITGLALKAVDPMLRFGGPATCQAGWIPEFISFVQAASKANGVPLADAVTSHLYPTDRQVPQNRDGFAQVIANASAVAAAAGLPLTMTEFNSGLGIGQLDLPYSASFVLHQQLVFSAPELSNVDTLSYWTVSDSGFEEGGVVSTPWADKYGIQTLYMVPKPVYRAFQMIAELPTSAVPVTVTQPMPGVWVDSGLTPTTGATSGTVDVIVATESAGKTTLVTALLTNYNLLKQPIGNVTISLTFTGIPVGAVVGGGSATVELLDSTHANAQVVWQAAGSPVYPSQAEVAAELAASQLVPQPLTLSPAGQGSFSCNVALEPYGSARVRFQYISA